MDYNRILVLPGGGADGAVTIGRLEKYNKSYEAAFSISTGSLIAPLALLREYGRLYTQYSSSDTKDITEKSAFNEDGRIKVASLIWRSLKSLVTSSNTIGESNALRDKIEKELTQKDYDTLRALGKHVYVGCWSMQKEEVTFFSSSEEKLSDFKDWMWASANPPIVFSLLEKAAVDGCVPEQWVDGGVGTVNPLPQAVIAARRGAEIDVFCHRPKPKGKWKKHIRNVFHFASRLAGGVFGASQDKDLEIGLYLAQIKECLVRVHWMDKELYNNSLVFGKDKMKALYEEGKRIAFNEDLVDIYDYRNGKRQG